MRFVCSWRGRARLVNVSDVLCSVRASNIGHEIQADELREAFKDFGEIKDVWVAQSPSGFAFIHFAKQDDAQTAINTMNGKELKGCTLQVEMSRSRRDPSAIKHGDWKCPQCHVNNFARRDSCYRCQAPKPSEGRSGGGGGGRGRSRSPRRDRGRYDDDRGSRRYDDDRRGSGRDDRDYGRSDRRRSHSR